MAWIQLPIAGFFEWGWPVGLKLGMAEEGLRWGWIAFAVARFFFVGLIVVGIVGLKLST